MHTRIKHPTDGGGVDHECIILKQRAGVFVMPFLSDGWLLFGAAIGVPVEPLTNIRHSQDESFFMARDSA